MRLLPGFAGHEIFGYEAGFSRPAGREIRVRQFGLGFVHRGLEASVHADFDELEQRRICCGTRVTNSFSTAAPSANSDCATAASAAASTRTNAASGFEPASVHASSTTRRAVAAARQKCRQKLTRGVGTAGLEFHLDERHEQRRIVPGGFTIEKAAGRLEVPALTATFARVALAS